MAALYIDNQMSISLIRNEIDSQAPRRALAFVLPRGGGAARDCYTGARVLAEVITVDALKRIAGPAVFERGVAYWQDEHVLAYWQDEHVLACDVAGQEVASVVKGSMRYLVRLANVGGALVAQCTCPVEAPLCKHAVALGLAYLARQGRVERADGAAGLGGVSGAAGKLAVGFARRADQRVGRGRNGGLEGGDSGEPKRRAEALPAGSRQGRYPHRLDGDRNFRELRLHCWPRLNPCGWTAAPRCRHATAASARTRRHGHRGPCPR